MTPDDKRNALRPLAAKMWRGHCWIKGQDGPRQIDQRFTEVQLSEHCAGTRTYGLCPIAPGESSTRVACLDLDSHKGETPFAKMVETANIIAGSLILSGQEPHLFTSSGGAGIHIYLTWADPQSAYNVRELLKYVLETCGLKSGTKGVAKNEVEIFPKQNEVPADGKGSMFILPWAGHSAPLGEFTGWRDSAAVPLYEREERGAPSSSSDVEGFTTLKSALDAIPNAGTEELSYDEWRNIIFAIHHATNGEEIGLSLAHEFSARSSKYKPEFLDNRVWPSIRSDRDGAIITARTIYSKASDLGWQDPTLADDFDVIEVESASASSAPGVAAAGAAPELPTRFKFVHKDEFAGAGPLDWIVEGVLPDADLAMVFGESQSGKSFWTVDLLLAISQGVPWQGRETTKARCAYVAAEGAAGFRNRLKAYRIEHPDENADLFVLGDTPNFLDPKHVRQIILQLQAIKPVKIVCVDTVAQVMQGGDENSGVDMGKLIMHCQMIKKHAGAMVVLIHHSGKDSTKGARGWSGMRGAIDTEIEVVRSNHDRVATITKQKDGADALEFGFKLRTVGIGNDHKGRAMTSCVVDHGTAVAAVRTRRVIVGPNERAMATVLKDRLELTGETKVVLSEWIAATQDAMMGNHETPGEANKAAKVGRKGALEKGLVLLVDGWVMMP